MESTAEADEKAAEVPAQEKPSKKTPAAAQKSAHAGDKSGHTGEKGGKGKAKGATAEKKSSKQKKKKPKLVAAQEEEPVQANPKVPTH